MCLLSILVNTDGVATVEAGAFVDGHWMPGRQLSGDDVLLSYNLDAAAAMDQSGSGLPFSEDPYDP